MYTNTSHKNHGISKVRIAYGFQEIKSIIRKRLIIAIYLPTIGAHNHIVFILQALFLPTFFAMTDGSFICSSLIILLHYII